MTTRLAICLGLSRLDPASYDGWPGECPGADRDAARFGTACHDAGFDGVTCLVNQFVQPRYVKPVFTAARKQLKAGDLLVLFNSGHGGQMPDIDGDEQDGKDETLLWWNGEINDDTIAKYLATLPKGVRVLFVADTCNSGTLYRGRIDVAKSTPMQFARAPRKYRGSLLHLGGCEDGRVSWGDTDGGQWTIALLDALNSARKPLTYREWYARAVMRMPDHQRPVWDEYGGESFADQEAIR